MNSKQISMFDGFVSFEETLEFPQIELEALYIYAKEQALKHWNRHFDIEIKLIHSKRKNINGSYTVNLLTQEKFISMYIQRNKERSWYDVKKTLLHELVHWHMHTTGQLFSDYDIEFAIECFKVGASISGDHKARKVAEKAYELINKK